MAKKEISPEDIRSIEPRLLADLLYEAIGRDKQLYSRVETLLLANDPSQLVKEIAKRIASIARGRKFIDYRHSFALADTIQSIVEDIERLVRDENEALKLLKKLILTDEKVYERCDDSTGVVQTSYAYAQELWRRYAPRTLDAKRLLNETRDLLILEGYGLRDILSDAMPPGVLEKLYEETLQNYLQTTDRFESYTQKHLLLELAQLLHRPSLYLDTLKAGGKEITEHDYLDIAKAYRKEGEAEETLHYLSLIDPLPFNSHHDYFDTLIWAYQQRGDEAAITEAYRRWYEVSHASDKLKAYLERLEPEAARKARQKALGELDRLTFAQRLELFMTLDAPDLCAAYLREHREEIETEYISNATLTEVTTWLAEAYPQEAILLWRDRVEHTLSRSISKYYPFAIKALKKIATIEKGHDTRDWYIEPNRDYIDKLAKEHNRKVKFISLLEKAFGER